MRVRPPYSPDRRIHMTPPHELLHATAHRPWPLPPGHWRFYQEWNRALFLHWAVDLRELRPLVPPELEIDLFEGAPWVSLVSFTMERMRPRGWPSFPPISDFHEINIRTYVRSEGRAGVHFLSIEGGKRGSCWIARAVSGLPHRYSRITRTAGADEARNGHHGDTLRIRYQAGSSMTEKRPLDRWLTERYALFQDTDRAINGFEIHHLEWPTLEVRLDEVALRYPRFGSLLDGVPHRCHYSPGVQVVAWGKRSRPRSLQGPG